jgi:hypothetical protein
MKSVSNYFRPISANTMKMKNLSAFLILVVAMTTVSCGKLLKKSSKGLPNDGQLHGVAPGSKVQSDEASRNGICSSRNIPHGTER